MPDGMTEHCNLRWDGKRKRLEERENDGPWRPVGTLAMETFNRLPDLPGKLADLIAALRRAATRPPLVLPLPTVHDSLPPPDAHAWGHAMVRTIGDALFQAGQVFAIRGVLQQHLAGTRSDARLDQLLHAAVRWVGPDVDGTDRFQTTPAGAVLLSGIYGVRRGRLRTCEDCKRFVVFPRGRWIGHRCDACKALRTGGRRSKLDRVKAERWARMQDRMRKRGFKRYAKHLRRFGGNVDELPERFRVAWKQMALDLLHQVTSERELDEWERTVVLVKGQSGRPKDSRTGEQVNVRAQRPARHATTRLGGERRRAPARHR